MTKTAHMTRKQLHRRWKRDMELFYGQSNSSTELPEFTGPVVGKIHYDPVKQTLNIMPSPPKQTPKT